MMMMPVLVTPGPGFRRRLRAAWRKLVRVLFYRGIARPFLWLVIGLQVRGLEHLAAARQVVVVSNHNSHLDTLVLLDLIGPERLESFRPVAAADYFQCSRFVSALTSLLFNILPICRKAGSGRPSDALEIMSRALEDGDSLIVFPEGTRGEPEEMARFRKGVGRLLTRFPRIEVIPVYQSGMGRILPRGAWYPVPFVGRVVIGEPRRFTGTASQITSALEAAVRELRDGAGDPPAP